MEAKVIDLLTGNPALVAYTIVAIGFGLRWLNVKVDSTVKEFKKLHKEAMTKIDTVNVSLTDVAKSNAVHSRELEIGEERFKALEEDNKVIRKTLHEIKGSMITAQQLEFLTRK